MGDPTTERIVARAGPRVRPIGALLALFAPGIVGGTATAQCETPVLEPALQVSSQLFGDAVSLSGSTALIGARRQFDPVSGFLAGAAYFFEESGGSFVQTLEVRPTNPSSFAEFAFSVSLDGDVAAVGYPGDDTACPGVFFCRSGAVEVYERESSTWSHAALLLPNDLTNSDEFGWAVSVDGDRILIGARRDDVACPSLPTCESGSAYIFERVAGVWTETAKLVASDTAAGDTFGSSVGLRGNRAIVAAPSDFSGGSGRVVVFEFDGMRWLEVQQVEASDASAGDGFGLSLSLAADLFAVGAPTSSRGGNQHGAVYLFEDTGGGFAEVDKLTDVKRNEMDLFGTAVSLTTTPAAGGTSASVLVGAPNRDVAPLGDEGAALLYERSPSGTWDLRLVIESADAALGDEFGKALAMQGSRAIVGDYLADTPGLNNTGIVRPYQLPAEALSACEETLSLAAGGSQRLELFASSDFAHRVYWTLGSVTGTSPGIPLPGGLVLPLAMDGYTEYTLANPNTALLSGSLGFLKRSGDERTTFSIPPDTDPGLAGTLVHHAFVVFDATLSPVFTSNASMLQLVP